MPHPERVHSRPSPVGNITNRRRRQGRELTTAGDVGYGLRPIHPRRLKILTNKLQTEQSFRFRPLKDTYFQTRSQCEKLPLGCALAFEAWPLKDDIISNNMAVHEFLQGRVWRPLLIRSQPSLFLAACSDEETVPILLYRSRGITNNVLVVH